MIPYGRHDISEADIDAVVEVLRSDFLTQGPIVPRFEQALVDYCGGQNGVAVNSATSALHLACLALDLGLGDWLWTSPNSFVASANSALYCGAKIDFVDIDPFTYNLCPEKLEQKLKQAEKKGALPKIVMPVHFAGQPCNMPAIHSLSLKYGFKIIEDASHAIGASYSNAIDNKSFPNITGGSDTATSQPIQIKVGSCTHSNITVFSFHPVKIITAGEGGIAMTNDAMLANRMRRLRTHGVTNHRKLMHPRPDNEIWNYQQIELGFNYRMTDIQAALGLSQLQRLDEFVKCRHKIAEQYDSKLKSLPIITPHQAANSYSSYHLYPIRVREILCGKTQQRVHAVLWENTVAANIHYIPIHRHPYFENLGFKVGDYSEAEQLHREVLTLPIFPTMMKKDILCVIQALKVALTT